MPRAVKVHSTHNTRQLSPSSMWSQGEIASFLRRAKDINAHLPLPIWILTNKYKIMWGISTWPARTTSMRRSKWAGWKANMKSTMSKKQKSIKITRKRLTKNLFRSKKTAVTYAHLLRTRFLIYSRSLRKISWTLTFWRRVWTRDIVQI